MTSVCNCQLVHCGGLDQGIPRLERHPSTTRPNRTADPHQAVPVHRRNHPEPGTRVVGCIQPLPKLPARYTDELFRLPAQLQRPRYHRTATGWEAWDGSQSREGTAQQ